MADNLNSAYLRYDRDRSDENLDALLDAVTRYATGYARRSQVREPLDVAQAITFKVWSSLPKYVPRCTFKTFVRRIARNHLVDAARTRKRKPEPEPVPEGVDLAETYHEPPTPFGADYDPASIACLSDRDRELLQVILASRDFDRAATVLGTSPRAVRERLTRIHTKVFARRVKNGVTGVYG